MRIEEIDPKLISEAGRRLKEIESGNVDSISLEEFEKEMKAVYARQSNPASKNSSLREIRSLLAVH